MVDTNNPGSVDKPEALTGKDPERPIPAGNTGAGTQNRETEHPLPAQPPMNRPGPGTSPKGGAH